MSDELLPYYDRELAFIRDLGKEFIAAHPKIAARLNMGPDEIKDPHLDRMVKAVAYLNARIRYKLDDDFPELTDALLQVLYPHYLAPVPSMTVVQFRPQPDATAVDHLPRHSELETDPVDGEPCRFRTCYPVTLWPVRLEAAKLIGQPLAALEVPGDERAQSVLHLSLRCSAPELSFAALAPDRLRLCLTGQEQRVFPLYDLLLNDPLQVAVGKTAVDPEPVLLTPAALRAVGFAPDEGLLPYPARSFLGYRLVTEFFVFPRKFLFFDVVFKPAGDNEPDQTTGHALAGVGERLELFIYLRRRNTELEKTVTADNFALGCTPVVNLFRQPAEPEALSHTQSEIEVVPDRRRRRQMEVYSVDQVSASDDQEAVEYYPFYGGRHAQKTTAPRCYWHASRRPARHYEGSETFLTLVDLDFNPAEPAGQKLSIRTTCLNRNLPSRLPFSADQPRLQLRDGGAQLSAIDCLLPPTPTLRPPLRRGALWRLVSHLSLNYLSLTDQQNDPQALREMLMLYDFRDDEATRTMINSIAGVSGRRASARVVSPDGLDGVCRGVDVTVQFDESRFTGNSLFLFASVLEHFLALYCSINSFTRMKATFRGGEEVLHRWPPRSGEQTIL